MQFKHIGAVLLIATGTSAISYLFPSFVLPLSAQKILAQTSTTLNIKADRLIQLGIQQFEFRQFEAAVQSFQQALVIYQQIPDSEGKRKAIIYLASTYYNLYKNEAEQLLQQSAQQLRNKQFEAAIQSSKKAFIIFQKIQDYQGEWRALNNLGNAYDDFGNHSQGIKYLQQGLTIARQNKDSQGEVTLMYSLAATYYNLKNYKLATEYFQQLLMVSQKTRDYQSETQALLGLLLISDSQGYYTRAIELARQLLARSQEAKDIKNQIKALLYVGQMYLKLGNFAKSIDYCQPSLKLSRKITDILDERNSLACLESAFRSVDNYTKAIEYNQEILVFSSKAQDFIAETEATLRLGTIYFSLGNYPKAIDYYQQGLILSQKHNDHFRKATALATLAATYMILNNPAKAVQYAQQSGKVTKEMKEIDNKMDMLNFLGQVYLTLNDYQKGIEYFQQLLTLAQESKNPSIQGIALNNLSSAQFLSGNLPKAEQILRQGIQSWESVRARLDIENSNKVSIFDADINKVSIFETQFRTYQILQQVLIARNKLNDALEIAERGRARALVNLLARKLSTNPTEQLTITAPNLAQIKNIAKATNSTLVQYSIIDNGFKVGLKPDTELELYIWVIQPTGVLTFRRIELKKFLNTSLKNFVKTSRQSIGVRGRDGSIIVEPINQIEEATRLKQLHQILINPITDLLPTDPQAHVIFIPQRDLFLVPFPALQDKDGKYLIEKHTILTAPAIQFLDLTQQQRAKVEQARPQGAIAVGNPSMPKVTMKIGDSPEQLKPLPSAEQEAISIAQLLNTKALIGKQATKAAILPRLSQARIIHLATHGLLDDFIGLGVPGAIALAPSGNGQINDGLLTANEILDLKLNAELVVLSACDTGRGRITGDGVIGLSRSLISAGVPSVMVSLWSVPDAPTAELMTEFYRNWLSRKQDKAQALRQAMLTTMKKHPNPKDWAAFTLIGEAK